MLCTTYYRNATFFRLMSHAITESSDLRLAVSLEIRREELASPAAQGLIRALNAELEARYPEEGANFFRLDAKEVAQGHGAFLVAFLDGRPVGCGAVRRIEASV